VQEYRDIQLSTVFEAVKKLKIEQCADGGVRFSGDLRVK
jgi:hypothetical protein